MISSDKHYFRLIHSFSLCFVYQNSQILSEKYTNDSLMEAVKLSRMGSQSIRSISKQYDIPRRTLRGYVSNAEKPTTPKPGPERMLTMEEETALVDYIMYMAEHNFPLSRDDLRSVILVNIIVTVQSVSNLFFHFSDRNIFSCFNKRTVWGREILSERQVLQHIIKQWLDDDCLSCLIAAVLRCPHPCVNIISQKLEGALLKFNRDEFYDFIFIEDIANVIVSCYDPCTESKDNYCPEIQKIKKYLQTSQLSPGCSILSDSN